MCFDNQIIAIRERAKPGSKRVVVGGGLLGLEAAASRLRITLLLYLDPAR